LKKEIEPPRRQDAKLRQISVQDFLSPLGGGIPLAPWRFNFFSF
jgi:hypothetical protein